MFSAVLDACALFPFSLRDTLLRLAETELYAPLWSAEILDEVRRNLVDREISPEAKADRMLGLMRGAFPEAEIDASAIERLIPAMTNDPKDRHVLAAAVAGNSELIVTFNLGDFPVEACDGLGVEAIHPDQFLRDLYDLDPEVVFNVVADQAAELNNPPMTLEELLNLLERGGLPQFAALLRKHAEI